MKYAFDKEHNDNSQHLAKSKSTVSLSFLSRWGAKNEFLFHPTDYSSTKNNPRYRQSPFPFCKNINNRFIIWQGDISALEVDAITNSSDESLSEINEISESILKRSGEQLKQEILTEIKECKTGDVCVSQGYLLPAKYILHTVAPIYSEQYKTASECALHSCYRNVLCKAKELGISSIALCVVSSTQKNFPPDIGAHIALRTVRRFLEQTSNETVVLCVNSYERGIYEVLAPLYFPRNNPEERIALWQLPTDIGGKNGEPLQADRQIRIIHNPHHSVMIDADDESDSCPHDLDPEGGISDLDFDRESHSLSSSNYGSYLNIGSFTQMQGDLDRQRLLGTRNRADVYGSVLEDGLEGFEQQERYEKLLHRARTEDLTEVSGIGCLYQSGVDRLGRPVIVFCGKWFPAQNIDLEKAILYLIYLLDPIVKGDYVIAYFHTLTSNSNYPSLHWLKEVYSILPYKYKKNLKAFYIVHPTFWTKMVTWWFTTFMAPAIKAKVHSLPGVEHLYAAISKDQLEIPAYITEYDMATNGLHYFQPVSQPSSPAF